MRAPAVILRLVFVASVGSLAAACSTSGYSGFNPFDGDPGGPPPSPKLWDGAYGGDTGRDAYADAGYGADRVTRSESTASERITRAPASKSRGEVYGTDRVDQAELPPPDEYRETARAPEPSYPQADTERGRADRTLTTTRTASATPDPAPSAAPVATPAPTGATHKVRSGEELSDIADAYGVREVDIIQANALKPPYSLTAGQNLKIPARARAEAPREGDYVRAGEVATPKPKPAIGAPPAADPKAGKPAPQPVETASAEGPRFDWPVSGKVISSFGSGTDGLYNEGINIAAPAGTPVTAAAAGTVRYAGNELRGYGNLVLIEHANGYVTAYAHNQVLTVKRGDKVARGDVIARVGQTGNVKSPQLHFEIRKGTKSIDPKKMLVARR